MDAGKKILLDLFTGSLRFVVPVYQRRYSWGEAQCRQLWADIVTAGRHPERTHFTGSIVWMQEGGIGPDGVSRCQLIDGQQRLMHFVLGPSHDKTGIVVRLLQTERSISFDHFGNISDFHNPTTLFEKAIIFSTYHIRRSLVRGLCSHP